MLVAELLAVEALEEEQLVVREEFLGAEQPERLEGVEVVLHHLVIHLQEENHGDRLCMMSEANITASLDRGTENGLRSRAVQFTPLLGEACSSSTRRFPAARLLACY